MEKIVIALPVHNEEIIIKKNAKKVADFCRSNLSRYQTDIIIADNSSTDKTAELIAELRQDYPEISYLFILEKGKGLAIKSAWNSAAGDIYSFMDIDLATDLGALPRLIESIKQGNDVAIGSRYAKGSTIDRDLVRKTFSLGYRWLLKLLLSLELNDAPCGFKAINQRVKTELLPQINNNQWFFDSELVILAEKQGYQIKEIAIDWSQYREPQRASSANTLKISLEYLKKIMEIRKRLKNHNLSEKGW